MPSRLSRYVKTPFYSNNPYLNDLPPEKQINETISNNPVQIRKQNKQEITPDNKKSSTKKSAPKEKKQRYITPFPDDIEKEIDLSLLDGEILSVDLNSIGEEEE